MTVFWLLLHMLLKSNLISRGCLTRSLHCHRFHDWVQSNHEWQEGMLLSTCVHPWLPGRVEVGLHWMQDCTGMQCSWLSNRHSCLQSSWWNLFLRTPWALSPGARTGTTSLPLCASVCQYKPSYYVLVFCISVENFIPEPSNASSCCTGNSET